MDLYSRKSNHLLFVLNLDWLVLVAGVTVSVQDLRMACMVLRFVGVDDCTEIIKITIS